MRKCFFKLTALANLNDYRGVFVDTIVINGKGYGLRQEDRQYILKCIKSFLSCANRSNNGRVVFSDPYLMASGENFPVRTAFWNHLSYKKANELKQIIDTLSVRHKSSTEAWNKVKNDWNKFIKKLKEGVTDKENVAQKKINITNRTPEKGDSPHNDSAILVTPQPPESQSLQNLVAERQSIIEGNIARNLGGNLANPFEASPHDAGRTQSPVLDNPSPNEKITIEPSPMATRENPVEKISTASKNSIETREIALLGQVLEAVSSVKKKTDNSVKEAATTAIRGISTPEYKGYVGILANLYEQNGAKQSPTPRLKKLDTLFKDSAYSQLWGTVKSEIAPSSPSAPKQKEPLIQAGLPHKLGYFNGTIIKSKYLTITQPEKQTVLETPKKAIPEFKATILKKKESPIWVKFLENLQKSNGNKDAAKQSVLDRYGYIPEDIQKRIDAWGV